MATPTTTITLSNYGKEFVFSDHFDYTGLDIGVYLLDIYQPKELTYTRISGYGSLVESNTNIRTKTVVPSDLSLTDTAFPDGVYKITITINYSDTTLYGTKTVYLLVATELKQCLYPKIARLAKKELGECGCGDSDTKALTDDIFDMYMQLESVQASIDCGMVADAVSKFDALVEFCDNYECGCDD